MDVEEMHQAGGPGGREKSGGGEGCWRASLLRLTARLRTFRNLHT